MKKQISTILFILFLGTTLQAQITRGAQEGELFISTDWYMDNYGHIHYGIFRSVDNGATITLQYESSTSSPSSEMGVGRVLGDATAGALYNIGGGELWVSYDYGISWEEQENYTYASFASGFSNGEIYRRSNYNLYRSEDYGSSFELIVESLTEPLSDVGNQNGQLFGFTGSAGVEYKLYHSLNYGNNFTFIPIDSSIAFWAPSGQFPQISRGTQSGEIYLVSWWLEPNYKIFHSVDTGYTWTEKYESETIDLYFWRVYYTAGREPGSFYVMRSRINEAGDHIWLYIDYSNDYGETFTTWFHDLDSTITGVITPEINTIKLSNFPNPFNHYTTFSFQIPANHKNLALNIFDIHGSLVWCINISGEKTQIWDGTDNFGRRVKEGIYLYNISNGNFNSQFNKLLIIN